MVIYLVCFRGIISFLNLFLLGNETAHSPLAAPHGLPRLPDPQHASPLFPSAQVAEEEAGDDTGEKDRDQRAFTDPFDRADLHIGETDGECHEDPIVCDLDLAEVQVIGVGNGIDEALSRKLQDVRDALQCYPQRNHGRTEEENDELLPVSVRRDVSESLHAEVDEGCKNHRHGCLQKLHLRKILFQYQHLSQKEDHIDRKGRLSEREGEGLAHDIGQTGDRRSPEKAFHHQHDAGGLDP